MSTSNIVYRGERVRPPGRVVVRKCNGVITEELTLPPSLRIRHTGFEWGYSGGGPAQLSLAILLDATGDRDVATRAYEWFMRAAVARWGASWSITRVEVDALLDQWAREDGPAPDLVAEGGAA